MRPHLLPIALLLAISGRADSYVRQTAIDVIQYEIALELSEATESISGTTRIHVRVLQDNVSSMWLDLEDMVVDRLLVSGQPRPFMHRDGRLAFEFDRPYRPHEIVAAEVHYHGRPGQTGMLIGKNKHGRRVFFTENWPDRAHHWFPCIDHPSDKATVDFAVTAPEKFDVVANGRLVETRSLMDGRKLTRWSERVPIPTYCMVIGAAEFSVTHAGASAGVPLSSYVYPPDAAAATRVFSRSGLALQYFSDLIGPYPYEKLAQIESTVRIGGMENSSVIFYAESIFQRASPGEGPVPHEIAHQWFGDSVTESDWDHLWLSEGFATYFNALFHEQLEGPEAVKRTMTRAAEAVKKYHQSRPAPIIDPEVKDPAKKLNAFTYQKGAWVLHMLRKILGDGVFFKGIQRYYQLHAGGNVLTEDFQRVMESVSGVSLDAFFRQWLYQPGWPDYRVSWRFDGNANELELTIRQAQTTGLFDMPVDIAFRFGERREIQSFRISEESHTFRIAVQSQPTSIEIDPDGWILKSVAVAAR